MDKEDYWRDLNRIEHKAMTMALLAQTARDSDEDPFEFWDTVAQIKSTAYQIEAICQEMITRLP